MFAKIVKDFDFYRKIPKDLTETSTHSTILSVCASLFMLVLFIVELWAFLTYRVSTNIVIDPNTDSMLRINFNITVLDMPCDYATIDVVDVLGTRHDNVTLNINKWQVDENGIRRGYQGRNPEQQDIMHEANLDLAQLQANGIHAVPLDTRNFDLWLSHHEYTFVDFFAPWCHWCQRLQPVWEALAERVETDHIPVSVVTVDCVDHPDLCLKYKIQAFPTMRMFKHGKPQSPDYHADRTVDAFVEFVNSRLALDEQLHMMSAEEREAHEKREEDSKSDHPGCMLSGFLLVNRVPGNFHIQMRSALHNINPAGANLSHVVNHLSFGPTLPRTALNAISIIPQDIFTIDSTQPMNDKMYTNLALHQAFHHYIKVVSTTIEAGRKYPKANPLLAYQMVQSSQIMKYGEDDVPEARFSYDLSPMSVAITTNGKPWYEFVTSLCALVGGTFTVFGLLSGFLNMILKPKKL